jgi:hypothetical protein
MRTMILAFPLLAAGVAPALGQTTGPAISPTEGVIQLFDGKSLDGLYTFLKDTKYEDPRRVFRVTDGMLHVTGDGLGSVITKNEYRDYHLVLEFKWGPRTWPPGKRKPAIRGS